VSTPRDQAKGQPVPSGLDPHAGSGRKSLMLVSLVSLPPDWQLSRPRSG
ncbi:uncharacterized protein METZ01_LOCUS178239, partial [marine metagenome]